MQEHKKSPTKISLQREDKHTNKVRKIRKFAQVNEKKKERNNAGKTAVRILENVKCKKWIFVELKKKNLRKSQRHYEIINS